MVMSSLSWGYPDFAKDQIYLRVPSELTAQKIFSGAEFIADANVLLSLTEEQVGAIETLLRESADFLDAKTLEQTIAGVLEEQQRHKRIAHLLTRVDFWLSRSDERIDELAKLLQESVEDNETAEFSAEQIRQFQDRVQRLVSDQPGYARQRKAQRLVKELGNPVSEIDLFCDIRPVFDDEHTAVEGALVVTFLKVVVFGADGLPIALEARLTESQVKKLAKKANDADKKLAVLKRLLAQNDVIIPRTELTGETELNRATD